ncbi:SAM-dependent methyltransferase [Amycolatopsis sp. NPDC049868]|uniref:SAM-dependent methyltransferase n=1 Tax=Amycolatopsis sp. NPDC049868 TaxID=3363934 RepID=UPI00378CCBB1
MPDHSSHAATPAAPVCGRPTPIVSLAEARVALAGVRGHAESDAVASILRSCRPGLEATIAAEYRVRNQVIVSALRAGIRQFVALSPDLPPLRLAHELLQAGTGCRVLYLLDDNERAVRTRLVTTHSLTRDVTWLSSTPGIEQCLRMGHGIGAINLNRPLCVVGSTALQHSRDPLALLAGLWNILPSGSWVAVNQVLPLASDTPTETGHPPACAVFLRHTRTPLILRTAPELDALFMSPYPWDLTAAVPSQIRDTQDRRSSLSTLDSSSTLITRVAVRPPRTRPHGLVPAYRSTPTS